MPVIIHAVGKNTIIYNVCTKNFRILKLQTRFFYIFITNQNITPPKKTIKKLSSDRKIGHIKQSNGIQHKHSIAIRKIYTALCLDKRLAVPAKTCTFAATV